MIWLYISLFVTSMIFVAAIAGIVQQFQKEDAGGVMFFTLVLATIIALSVPINLTIRDAQEMEQIVNRTKVENLGFNFLYKGETDNEVCLYSAETPQLDVFYCEDKS